jgi:hypothetical protein
MVIGKTWEPGAPAVQARAVDPVHCWVRHAIDNGKNSLQLPLGVSVETLLAVRRSRRI